MMAKEFKRVTYRLDLDLVKELQKISKSSGISQTFLVSKALQKVIEEIKALENEK
jgi:predicted DNA-binding protein